MTASGASIASLGSPSSPIGRIPPPITESDAVGRPGPAPTPPGLCLPPDPTPKIDRPDVPAPQARPLDPRSRFLIATQVVSRVACPSQPSDPVTDRRERHPGYRRLGQPVDDGRGKRHHLGPAIPMSVSRSVVRLQRRTGFGSTTCRNKLVDAPGYRRRPTRRGWRPPPPSSAGPAGWAPRPSASTAASSAPRRRSGPCSPAWPSPCTRSG